MPRFSYALALIVSAAIVTSPTPALTDIDDGLVGGLMGGMIGSAIGDSVQEQSQRDSAPATQPTNSGARARVRQVQSSLNYFGFDAGAEDGLRGPSTRSAISRYQTFLGHSETGELTAFQRDFLLNSYNRARAGGSETAQLVATLPEGRRGLLLRYRDQRADQAQNGERKAGAIRDAGTKVLDEDRAAVLEAQRRLNGLGYPAGPEDGMYGARTEEAVKVYQNDQNQVPHGHVTAKLLQRLRGDAGGASSVARNESDAKPEASQVTGSEAPSQGVAQNGSGSEGRASKAQDLSGYYAYVALKNAGALAVVDLAAGKVVDRIETGPLPGSAVTSADGSTAVVVNDLGKSISIIDLAEQETLQRLDLAELVDKAVTDQERAEAAESERIVTAALGPQGARVYLGLEFGVLAYDRLTDEAWLRGDFRDPRGTLNGSGTTRISRDGSRLSTLDEGNLVILETDDLTKIGELQDAGASAFDVAEQTETSVATNSFKLKRGNLRDFTVETTSVNLKGSYIYDFPDFAPVDLTEDGKSLFAAVAYEPHDEEDRHEIAKIAVPAGKVEGIVTVGGQPLDGMDLFGADRFVAFTVPSENLLYVLDAVTLETVRRIDVGPTPSAYANFVQEVDPASSVALESELATDRLADQPDRASETSSARKSDRRQTAKSDGSQTVGSQSQQQNGVTVDSDGGGDDLSGHYAYIALKNAAALAVVDLAAGEVVERIQTGPFPRSAVTSADGSTALVINDGDESISIIDIAERETVQRLKKGRLVGKAVSDMERRESVVNNQDLGNAVLGPAGQRVYVGIKDGGVIAYDRQTDETLIRGDWGDLEVLIGDGAMPRISRDGSRLFLAQFPDLAIIDTETLSVTGIVPHAGKQPFDVNAQAKSVAATTSLELTSGNLRNVTVETTDVDWEGNSRSEYDIPNISPVDLTEDGESLFKAVIDESDDEGDRHEIAKIAVPAGEVEGIVTVGGGRIEGVDVFGDDGFVAFTVPAENSLYVLDATTLEEVRQIDIGPTPTAYADFVRGQPG